MPDHSPSTIDEQIAAVEREIKQRARVYPRWVEQEKMTQALADRETKRMEDVLATLNRLRELFAYSVSGRTPHEICGFLDGFEDVAPMPPQGSLL